MKMRKLISFLLLSFVAYTLQAQIKDPVKFKTELNSLSDTEAEIVFTAAIDKGRSEERRVGKECLRLCRSRWSPYH